MNKLEDTAELVAERRKNISDIRAAIAAQEEIVAENERHRQAHTLQAAMGDVAAKEDCRSRYWVIQCPGEAPLPREVLLTLALRRAILAGRHHW